MQRDVPLPSRSQEPSRWRSAVGRGWIIAASGLVYLVSQVTILVIVSPLGASLIRLQCCSFTAEDTVSIFRHWEETGRMTAYRAHFAFDDVHWVWYAVFFTALLCWLFERHRVSHRLDWILLLPLVSGLLDAYENRMQQVFLGAADHAAIVDPLPLLGTLASDAKWALVGVYGLIALVLLARRRPTEVGP